MRENYKVRPLDGSEDASWIRIPSPPSVSRSEVIWHYTNTAGLVGILQSDRLWATAASMLNDSSELEYGLALATETFQGFMKDSAQMAHDQMARFLYDTKYEVTESLRKNNIFAVCATQEDDDLGQWRGYAEGSGYAIGLRAEAMCGVCDEGDEPQVWRNRDAPASWRRVVYAPKEQQDLLTDVWAFAAQLAPRKEVQEPDSEGWRILLDTAVSAMTNAIALIKHPGFWAEREVRFAFDASRHPGLLKFRPGPHGVTPYVELARMPQHLPVHYSVTDQPQTLPIQRVVVGPAQDMVTAQRGLETMLRRVGRGRVQIAHSAVPYR